MLATVSAAYWLVTVASADRVSAVDTGVKALTPFASSSSTQKTVA